MTVSVLFPLFLKVIHQLDVFGGTVDHPDEQDRTKTQSHHLPHPKTGQVHRHELVETYSSTQMLLRRTATDLIKDWQYKPYGEGWKIYKNWVLIKRCVVNFKSWLIFAIYIKIGIEINMKKVEIGI